MSQTSIFEWGDSEEGREIEEQETPETKDPFELAKTKYAKDKWVQKWLHIYERGLPPVKIKKGKKKIKMAPIPPHSSFAKEGLIKAIKLREENKVLIKEVKKSDSDRH